MNNPKNSNCLTSRLLNGIGWLIAVIFLLNVGIINCDADNRLVQGGNQTTTGDDNSNENGDDNSDEDNQNDDNDDTTNDDATNTDTVAPVPGNGGGLSFSNIHPDEFTVHWTKANDNFDNQAQLEYQVFFDEVGSVPAASFPFQADIDSLTIDGLSPSTTYDITVIVQDRAGNQALYTIAAQTTGASGLDAISTATATGIDLVQIDLVTGYLTIYTQYDIFTLTIDLEPPFTKYTIAGADYADNTPAGPFNYPNGLFFLPPFESSSDDTFDITYSNADDSQTVTVQATIVRLGPPPELGATEVSLDNYDAGTYQANFSWAKATDTVTAQSALEYKVVWSNVSDLWSINNIEVVGLGNGGIIQDWTADIDSISFNLNATTPDLTYNFWVAVLVRDGEGYISLYDLAYLCHQTETGSGSCVSP